MKCESKYPEEVVDALAEQLQNVRHATNAGPCFPWHRESDAVRDTMRAAARLALDLNACPRGWTREDEPNGFGDEFRTVFRRVPTPTQPDPVAEAARETDEQQRTAAATVGSNHAPGDMTYATEGTFREILHYIDCLRAEMRARGEVPQ